MIHYATRLPPGKPVILLNDTTIRKTTQFVLDRTFQFMDAVIKHFIRNPDPLVVPIYNYRVLSNKRDNNSYQYDMMRLGLLSKEERSLVDDASDLADKYGKGFWSEANEDFYLKFQQHYKLASFLETISIQGRYHDLHSGNVMMDMDGDYRLVDLEGFTNNPLEALDNDWITRNYSEAVTTQRVRLVVQQCERRKNKGNDEYISFISLECGRICRTF